MKYRSAFPYYLLSIPTILQGFDPVSLLPGLFRRQGVARLKNGMKLMIEEPMDIWVIKEVILDNGYQKYYQVKPGDIVIDIGASLGDFSIFVSKKAKTVYSYEMSHQETALMKQNLTLNECENVTLREEKVESLDTVFADESIDVCDLLKMDCEGAEYPIFNHSHDATIKKIKHMAMEVHLFTQDMTNEYMVLIERLQRLGYRLTKEENPVHRNIGYLYAELT